MFMVLLSTVQEAEPSHKACCSFSVWVVHGTEQVHVPEVLGSNFGQSTDSPGWLSFVTVLILCVAGM
jgi:hypothetical protein